MCEAYRTGHYLDKDDATREAIAIMTAVVELDEVTKSYPGGVTAVRGVSLYVQHGEMAAIVQEYEQVYRAFQEAEARYDDIRGPYEQALQSAQQDYESKRQQYLRMVEDIREQLEKAPDEYRQRFDEIRRSELQRLDSRLSGLAPDARARESQ